MKKAFMCSLCHQGLIGGGLYLDEQALTFKCSKLTVESKYRKLVLPLGDIKAVRWHRRVPLMAVLEMKNGEEYKLLIFNKRRFEKWFMVNWKHEGKD